MLDTQEQQSVLTFLILKNSIFVRLSSYLILHMQ